ncbi:MAG: SDR family oxidoreductase [Parvularculaceae bacterium]|nr:SDR family oxidoreductase [Parvularculaceae bacterium]MCB2114594.1 SDR family oxidoreductase [Parvularculaceae bacterium]
MEFSGITAWVTGASSGIGEALAKALSARGAAVILSGRRVEALEKVTSEIDGATFVLPFEATDYDALPAVVAKALEWRGGVDLLVNNAGVSQRSLALDTSFDVYRRMMEIDFFAPVRLTQLVLPSMTRRKSGGIVIVSSVAGKVGAPLRTAYCAAKHACIGYFDALRAEIEKAYGVKICVVTPGSVRTNIATNAMTGDGAKRGRSDDNIENGMPPEQAAAMILDGLAHDRREVIVAEGMELAALQMRAQNPDALFDFVAAEGARLAEQREAGADIEPAFVNRDN